MYAAPTSVSSAQAAANSSGVVSYAPVDGSGRPAFGLRISGRSVVSRMARRIGATSFGPSEQLTPTACTPSADSDIAAQGALTPRKVRPDCSNVIEANTGSSQHSFAASTPARSSFRSENVSKNTASAPASAPARIICAKSAYASSKRSVPRGSSSSPIGPISSATLASVPAQARLATATDARTTSSTAKPVPASLCAFAQNVLASSICEPACTYCR